MYSTADVSGFSGGGEGVMGGWRGFGHVGVFANSRNQRTAESEIPPSDLPRFIFSHYLLVRPPFVSVPISVHHIFMHSRSAVEIRPAAKAKKPLHIK